MTKTPQNPSQTRVIAQSPIPMLNCGTSQQQGQAGTAHQARGTGKEDGLWHGGQSSLPFLFIL
jgi:hypothetical protein